MSLVVVSFEDVLRTCLQCLCLSWLCMPTQALGFIHDKPYHYILDFNLHAFRRKRSLALVSAIEMDQSDQALLH